jgi:hypothetical protein
MICRLRGGGRRTNHAFMKLVPLLLTAVLLTACNSPQRFEANRSAAQTWLTGQAGTARGNVTGAWRDATRDAWGDARLVQRGNKITGTLGDYEVDGVMNGSRVFLALKTDDWYYYSVEALHKGSVLEGRYSRGVPVRLTKGQSEPFVFRRAASSD